LDAKVAATKKLWKAAGSPKNYKLADLPKMAKARRRKQLAGAGAVLGSYAAYRTWKSRKKKEESLLDGLDEIREIALSEHNIDFSDNEVLFFALLDALDETGDESLEEDIYIFGEEIDQDPFDSLDEKKKGKSARETFMYGTPPRKGPSPPEHGFLGSAGQAAGVVAGTEAARAVFKRKRRRKLFKDIKHAGEDVKKAAGKAMQNPYAKGAAIAGGAIGAAELARRLMKKRKKGDKK
jgi:hypothetical protein